MKRYVCDRCQWSMPETCVRAIEAHQQEHPTEEQRKARSDRSVLANVADAMATGRALDAIERIAALHAILTADPGVMADEIFFKPIRREIEQAERKEAEHGE